MNQPEQDKSMPVGYKIACGVAGAIALLAGVALVKKIAEPAEKPADSKNDKNDNQA